MHSDLKQYCLQLADNSLIHGHRLSEWCGHGPILEVDMALSNIALDNIGAARSIYAFLAEQEGEGKTEDYYPYTRDVREFLNVLLVELPNGDFADTMAKCLFFDAYQFYFYTALKQCNDSTLAAIAEKSLKEVTYHLRFSSEWVIRLGDGTEESKENMQRAISNFWEYTGELFQPSAIETSLQKTLQLPDLNLIRDQWMEKISEVLQEATLSFPLSSEKGWFQQGGKTGIHSEHLGFILADLQFMQRAYPNSEW
ncbi:MAG: phenylacetate-CoA oxygenase subunit PaaC [Chitinophagaceae bacterium]|nr:phenylacetate-CoA oxygenase subunit PaaC [Chitinophagaceae bacterium]